MKRISLFFILLFLPSLLAADSRTVRLRIFDADEPQANVEVQVTYPDGDRSTGTTLQLTSDARGYVEFALGANVFWVTVPALNDQVRGRRFDVPKSSARQLRWDVRPREWKAEVQR